MKFLTRMVAASAPCLLSSVLFAQAEHTSPDGLSSSDWSSIRAAYEAGRHRAFAVDGGLRARNPGQNWLMNFDGQGIFIQPDEGDWSWGLQLRSYGFAGKLSSVQGSAESSADGGRVAYAWSEDLEEWYINSRQGLEHGYTLAGRPDGGSGPLLFDIAVLGGLVPETQAGGRGIHFLEADGDVALTYTGLFVVDAEGTEQSASLQATEDGIRMLIDEAQAVYPLTIDPMVQVAYLKASNTGFWDRFGTSVAISDGLVVVGAPQERSSASGVNGDQSDNSAVNSGAVYVFERNAGVWSQQAYLKASNTDAGDSFGRSVAISGNLVVVGASSESSHAFGVNGNQASNNVPGSGAAYVFERSAGVWSQQAYIKASNTGVGDLFGLSVGISGNLVVVGAFNEDSNSVGVNGNQSNNSASEAGAAYIFERNGGVWSQQAYLKASNSEKGDRFGFSTAVSGDLVVVSAHWEDSDATGVNGNQSDNNTSKAGAAYVFERTGGVWSQQAYLKASNPDPDDFFGLPLAISGELVVVGAWGENSNAAGVDGNQADNSLFNPGAAYVFERNAGVWSQQAYLKASNPDPSDRFGYSVGVSGGLVVVGAPFEESNATGANGDSSNNSLSGSGAAYVFERTGGVWGQQTYLKASNTDWGDFFGLSVAISGDLVVIGAPRERSNATGVDGNQLNSAETDESGAAYVFEVDANIPVGANYCSPNVANSTGMPATLVANGSAVVAEHHLSLSVTDLPPNVFGMFFTGQTQGFFPAPGGSQGNLCMGGSIGRYGGPGQIQSSGPDGAIFLALELTQTTQPSGFGPIMPGETWNFQVWYRDTVGGVPTSNLSDAVEITFQ